MFTGMGISPFIIHCSSTAEFPCRGLLSHAAVPKGDPCGWIRTQSRGIFITHIFCFSPHRRNYQNGEQLWIKWEIIGEWVEISQNKWRQILKQKWATGAAGLSSGALVFCFLPSLGAGMSPSGRTAKQNVITRSCIYLPPATNCRKL